MENINLIWSFTFLEDFWYCWHLAGADIFIRRKGNYWYSYCRKLQWAERGGGYSGPVQEEPDTADGINNPAASSGVCCLGKELVSGFNTLFNAPRGGVLNPSPTINTAVWNGEMASLQLCFSEKPFLLNMEGLRLLPGTEISRTLQLPPAFRLIAGNNLIQSEPEEILFTFTPFMLKEAWYGEDTMRGILCSSLPGILKPEPDGTAELPPGIECTVLIRNRNKAPLELNKVPLYTDTLAVYEKDGKFISDKPVIEPHGGDFRETIIKEQGNLLAPPAIKNGMGDTLIRRGTEIIKNITGL